MEDQERFILKKEGEKWYLWNQQPGKELLCLGCFQGDITVDYIKEKFGEDVADRLYDKIAWPRHFFF